VRLTVLAGLFFALVPVLAGQNPGHIPQFEGYVSRVGSMTDFDANGFRVILSGETEFARRKGTGALFTDSALTGPEPYIGAHVQIFGRVDAKKQTVRAKQVFFVTAEASEVKGSAVIDDIPVSKSAPGEGKLVRADGYFILLDSKTEITFRPPLASLADVGPNVWITYRGGRRADGIVVASAAVLIANSPTPGEKKAQQKFDYDPTTVNPDEKQNPVNKALFGVDPKKLPPYPDSAMQSRVARIGESLLPKYQRDLPDNDAAKVRFRFEVVDLPGVPDAAISPGGVILIPRQVVDRMENDSQLAAVLADAIAGHLEKAAYRELSLKHEAEVAELLELGSLYSLAPGLIMGKKISEAEQRIQDQAARVSLWLMKDAGYTLSEAPKAWWILATKKPKPLVDLKLPERVAYLYEVLGTNWRE
jgi:hypothetical protein